MAACPHGFRMSRSELVLGWSRFEQDHVGLCFLILNQTVTEGSPLHASIRAATAAVDRIMH